MATDERGQSGSVAGPLLYGDLTRRIIGCFFEVHRELGHGFLESVYEVALVRLLRARGMRAERQVAIPVRFKGEIVGVFRADIIVEGCVVLELKAVVGIDRVHEAQLLNYLRASRLGVGFILNFGTRGTFKRLVGPAAQTGICRRP